MAYNEELDIRMLLERYMEAECSLEEEARLKAYFNQKQDIPADLIYAKAMFCTFQHMKQTKSPQNSTFVAFEQPKKHRVFLSKFASMAASLIIGVVVGGSIALVNQHREEILSAEHHRKSEQFNNMLHGNKHHAPRVYGYINGQPITDVHEACYRGAMSLKTMGVQMNKPSHALAGFEIQKAGLTSTSNYQQK